MSLSPYVQVQSSSDLVQSPPVDYSSLSKSPFIHVRGSTQDTSTLSSLQSFELFTHLPYEIQFHILLFVSYKDICSIQLTCKHFRQLALENSLWKELTNTHFGIDKDVMLEFGNDIMDWRSYFRLQYSLYSKGFITSEKIQTCVSKPRPRFAHTGCAYGEGIIYIGGQMAEGRSNEIFYYEPKTNVFSSSQISNFNPLREMTQIDISDDCKNFKGVEGKVPSFARHQSAMINNKIYTFGGYDYTYFYNLSIFDPKEGAWTYPTVTGDVPCPRSNHSSAVVGDMFYIFGGSVGDNVDKYTVTDDFYCLDTKTMNWSRVDVMEGCSESPSRRVGHVMTAVGKHIYLFGGGVWGKVTGWTQQYNDLYIYSTQEKRWSLVPLKNEEKPPVCTYPYIFPLAHNVFVFGGASISGNTVTNQLYMWDILARKWTEITVEGDPISARSIGSANVVNDEVIMWGGYCGGILPQDNDFFKMKMNFKGSVGGLLGSS